MGLFDGMKDAFSAPNSMSIDSERETPIDRWMGWNVKSNEEQERVASSKCSPRYLKLHRKLENNILI